LTPREPLILLKASGASSFQLKADRDDRPLEMSDYAFLPSVADSLWVDVGLAGLVIALGLINTPRGFTNGRVDHARVLLAFWPWRLRLSHRLAPASTASALA
jgi:hypothetical protein